LKYSLKHIIATKILLFLTFCFLNLPLLSQYKSLEKSLSVNFQLQYAELFKKGEYFRLEGEYEKSINFFEESLNLARKNASEKHEIESLLRLGLLFWNIGKLKESSDMYTKTLPIAQKLNLKIEQEKCLTALEIYKLYTDGKDYRLSGQYEKSIEIFKKAIDLAKKNYIKEYELKCLRQLSLTYWELNSLQEFLSLNKEALEIANTLKHKQEEGRCLNNIGIYYWKTDNYSNALNYYEKALKIAKELKNIKDESECLNNIGITYNDLGNYEKSLEYLIRAKDIDAELGDDVSLSMDLNNIGEIFRRKGLLLDNKDFNNALDNYNKSLKLARKTNDNKTEIKVLNNIGAVYSYIKNYVDALKFFQSGLKKAEEIQEIEAMSMILNNIGIVYSNKGDFEESTKFYQKAIDLAHKIGGGQILWEAYLEIANAYKKQKKFNEALENYKNSITVIEDIRSTIELEELKASFLGTDKRLEAYQNMIDLLVALHKSEPEKAYNLEAFNYLERAKARAFLDSLEVSTVSISQGIDFRLLNQETEIMNDISKLYTKLLYPELTLEQKNDIYNEIKRCEDKLESLKNEIRLTSPAYANLKYPKPITLNEAQGKLPDSNTAFFAYCIGTENSYAFVISKKNLKIFPIASRKEIKKQVSEYLKVIAEKENHDFHLGYELFKELVLPGLDKNIKKIIFIPDDILYFLPFETLLTNEEKKSWLIKDYKIAYAPSISSLREIIQRKREKGIKPQKDILAFGNPSFGLNEKEDNGGKGEDIFQNFFSNSAFKFFRLKYSGLEIERIASLFKKKKIGIFQKEDATEERLKELKLTDYKIIHFATHGLIYDEKPARSSIVLSLDQDPAEDGFLQMREIFNLKLNSDLITLSACQTGLGQFWRGEGIEGFSRAFFYAGSSSVLMSLWPVNDQASYQLMERFYYHLRSSESIMNALQKAKLEMISSEALSHPFYWGGFIITGNADKIIFPRRMNRWIILICSLGGGWVILVIMKRLRKKSKISLKKSQ